MFKLTKRKLYITIAAGLTGLALLFFAQRMFSYFHQPINLVYNLTDQKVDKPIKITFSQPVQEHVNYNITPALAGSWQASRNLFGITSLTFYPSQPLVAGSSYQLILGHVVPLFSLQPTILDKTLPITVEKPAGVASLTPDSGASNVPVDTAISIKLATPNRGLRKLVLTSDAKLASDEPATTDDTTFTWKLAQPLSQGVTYHLALADANQSNPAKRELLASTFTTVPEPHIASATNRDHFYPGDTITVTFDQDMKQVDSGFKFDFAGSGHWQDARTYVFTPSGLAPGSSNPYTVLKGALSATGGVTEADHPYTISPPGAVYVTGSSPRGSNIEVGSGISFSFDQPVDHASAQSAFSISPTATGNFSWSGNTMTFQPNALGYQTSYMALIGPGVKGTYGLPSTRSFADSFSTTYQVIKLNVPYYHQTFALSCEVASLRMALAYRGINVTDLDLLGRINYSPRPRDTASNSWDNPYQMFVGDVNGVQGVTGWGVYGPPIETAARSFGRGASYISGISVNQVAQAIRDGNPVVLWGIGGTSVKSDSWNTSSGVVQAPANEHARTIYGVAGSTADPVGFYLHDPIYGDLYWTTSQLQWNMTFAGTLPSQGVITY